MDLPSAEFSFLDFARAKRTPPSHEGLKNRPFSAVGQGSDEALLSPLCTACAIDPETGDFFRGLFWASTFSVAFWGGVAWWLL